MAMFQQPSTPPGNAQSSQAEDLTHKFPPLTPTTGLHTPPATPVPVSAVEPYPTIHCTKEVPFEPVVENLRSEGISYYQSIVCQEPYTNASFEELRYVDYFNGLRFGSPAVSVMGKKNADKGDSAPEGRLFRFGAAVPISGKLQVRALERSTDQCHRSLC